MDVGRVKSFGVCNIARNIYCLWWLKLGKVVARIF